MTLLRVIRGENDLLVAADGRRVIDLISSTGAVFLGHANAAINDHVVAQLGRISCSWTSTTDVQDECREVVERHLGDGLRLHSLYSSGMEAVEVALRMACHETGRTGVVGFDGGHHGKSIATQAVTGDDKGLPEIPGFRPLPYLPDHDEDEVLQAVDAALGTGEVAAVVVEPVQGRGGGHAPTTAFLAEVQQRCRATGTFLVCDEVFCGFHRTGPGLRSTAKGLQPDLVVVGKAMANGFPAAGVLVDPRLRYHPKDFRFTSTFSDNPLACAAVVGTVTEMERIDVEAQVARIEEALRTLPVGASTELRLHGAACFVELSSEAAAAAVHRHLLDADVLALCRGRVLGLWPPATITDEHLHRVVEVTGEALTRWA